MYVTLEILALSFPCPTRHAIGYHCGIVQAARYHPTLTVGPLNLQWMGGSGKVVSHGGRKKSTHRLYADPGPTTRDIADHCPSALQARSHC